jgi:hypothetical protein
VSGRQDHTARALMLVRISCARLTRAIRDEGLTSTPSRCRYGALWFPLSDRLWGAQKYTPVGMATFLLDAVVVQAASQRAYAVSPCRHAGGGPRMSRRRTAAGSASCSVAASPIVFRPAVPDATRQERPVPLRFSNNDERSCAVSSNNHGGTQDMLEACRCRSRCRRLFADRDDPIHAHALLSVGPPWLHPHPRRPARCEWLPLGLRAPQLQIPLAEAGHAPAMEQRSRWHNVASRREHGCPAHT